MSGEKATCGCVVGGLHRYACAGVGHVDPLKTTPVPSEVAETTAGEREVCSLNEDCIAGPHAHRVQRRFPSWADDVDASHNNARAEGWDKGHMSHAPVLEFGETPCDCTNPYRAASVGRGEGL